MLSIFWCSPGHHICRSNLNPSLNLLLAKIHSIYLKTVSSYLLSSALLNWYKLVYGPIGQTNMRHALDIYPSKNNWKWIEYTRAKVLTSESNLYTMLKSKTCGTEHFSRDNLILIDDFPRSTILKTDLFDFVNAR